MKMFSFYRSYSTALVSVCDSGLAGLIILLISSAISGFLFTTLVWCNSHTWIYFKHKGRYIKVSLICLHLHREGEAKAELPQEGILFLAQFPSMGFFINKNFGFRKD